jgi:hypothetical protein
MVGAGYSDGVPFATNEGTRKLKVELGGLVLSVIRWCDDLGLDVLECLDLAIESQEKLVEPRRP